MESRVGKSGRFGLGLVLALSVSAAQAVSIPAPPNDPCAPEATCPNASLWRAPPPPIPEEEQQLRRQPHSADNDLKIALLVAAAIILAAVIADQLTGKKWASPQDLDANGPRFPEAQALGRFQVQGYAQPGWPFAVDFEALPGTHTWLALHYKDGKHKRERVDLPYVAGRHIQVLQLPVANRGAGIARYTLHSAIDVEGERPAYQPLKVYGLGAGPEAVGSLYLSVTEFGPSQAHDPDRVGYAIEAKRPFNRAQVEVLQLPKAGNHLIRLAFLDSAFIPHQVNRASWAKMPFKSRPGAGVYELQARAWGTGDGGKDWTGAFAPNYVFIR